MLRAIRDGLGVEVTTDFHLPYQAGPVAEVVDVIQIPAFLSRQTDIVVSAAEEAKGRGKVVSVKKAQWMRPSDMINVKGKIDSVGEVESWGIERGSVGPFGGLVVDMAGLPVLGRIFDKVIFDATHSVQMMGTPNGSPENAPVLARAAVAAGADGVFIEVHPYPPRAKCDGANSIQLSEVPHIVEGLKKIWDTMREVDTVYPDGAVLYEKARLSQSDIQF
jgi:2-dehydro-3-deoxyphosphooctonate aldolase (KDO 8-P synthase)